MTDRRTLLQAFAALGASALAPHALAQAPERRCVRANDSRAHRLPAAGSGNGRESHACLVHTATRFFMRALVAVVASTPASELDAAIAARKLDKVANELVAAWYSGMVDGKVVLYTDALVWTAMAYSKPMGICGGVTGYWADPWTPT